MFNRGIVVVVVCSLVVPFAAFAQTDRARGGTNFCENLDSAEERVLNSIGNHKSGQRRDFSSRKTDRMTAFEAKREENDTARDTRYEALRDRAEADEQKAAVEIFIETAERLVEERRAAVDAAITTFEETIEDLTARRNEAVDGFLVDLESDIGNAFADAQEACDDGTPGAEVRADLREALSVIRTDYREKRSEINFSDELREARETRRAAIAAALETFKEGLEAAKEILRAAFA